MKNFAYRSSGRIFEAIHIKSDEVLLANRASICLIQRYNVAIDVEGLITIKTI